MAIINPVKPLLIGSILLKSNLLLAPLESVSDVGFRHICYKNGAALTFTEMIRAQAIARNNNSALDLIDTHDPETLTGLQLLAKSADELIRALNRIEHLALSTRPHFKNISVIDLNFGCPSKDVINEGAGPAMLKRKTKLLEIFSALVSWRQSTSLGIKAVGAKIRLGLNESEQKSGVYLGVVDSANRAGLDYLTVHGRNAMQRSRDNVNWGPIGEIKKIATMPVLGNGDLRKSIDLEKIQHLTQCDGFMIARAAIANPFVFSSLTTGKDEIILPNSEDLLSAELSYAKWSTVADTKIKFRDFHNQNFSRMRKQLLCSSDAAKSSEYQLIYPKNKHFS